VNASTVDNQLFTQNLCACRLLDPGERLFRKAGHLVAIQAKKMDVSPSALAQKIAMPAKAPHAICTLNPVKKAGLL
jgi:hypothetical protein